MKGKKTGGRQKGSMNKATIGIKELLDTTVDFNIVIEKLFELAKGVSVEKPVAEGIEIVYKEKPDANAAKVLLSYRFGMPKQEIENTGDMTLTITRRVIAASKPGTDLHSTAE